MLKSAWLFKNLYPSMEESTFELDRTLEIHLIQLSGFTNEEIEAYFFPLAHKALTSWKDAVSPQLTYLINQWCSQVAILSALIPVGCFIKWATGNREADQGLRCTWEQTVSKRKIIWNVRHAPLKLVLGSDQGSFSLLCRRHTSEYVHKLQLC